jgi:hypothetical protein
VSSVFAVQMKAPSRGRREVEVVVAEARVLLGIEDSSIADAGSPRKSEPILSISSIRNTGLADSASRIARMIVPGIAPM